MPESLESLWSSVSPKRLGRWWFKGASPYTLSLRTSRLSFGCQNVQSNKYSQIPRPSYKTCGLFISVVRHEKFHIISDPELRALVRRGFLTVTAFLNAELDISRVECGIYDMRLEPMLMSAELQGLLTIAWKV